MASTTAGELPPVHRGGLTRVKWGAFESIFATIGIYIVPQAFAVVILALVYGLQGKDFSELVGQDSKLTLLLYTLLAESITIGLVYAFLRYRKSGWRDLGFRKPQKNIVWAIGAGYVAYFLLLIAIMAAVSALFPSFNIDQAQETGYEGTTGSATLLPLIGLVFLPPLIEEILFRGLLYQGLRTRFGMLLSALIVSVLFGVAHQQWNVGIDTFILSMVMVYAFEKTNSLWAPIGIHMLKNAIAFVVLFVA